MSYWLLGCFLKGHFMTQEEIADYIIQSEAKIRELKLLIESQVFFDFIPKTNPNPEEITRAAKFERNYVTDAYTRIRDNWLGILKNNLIPFALSDVISTIIELCEKNIKIVEEKFEAIHKTLNRGNVPLYELKEPYKHDERTGI